MSDPRTPTDGDDLLRRYEDAVAATAGNSEVTGVDIGYLYNKNGKRTGEIDVRVHMKPGAGGDEGPAGTHVVGAEYLRGMPSVIQNVLPADPIQPGISISNERIRGGTIGLIVSDKGSGEQFVLSNAHVLGLGQDSSEWVIQPAMYLGGTALDPTHLLGHVRRSVDDLNGDAAIASIETGRSVEKRQFRSQVLIESADVPSLGDKVEKDGMGTRVRCGFVDGMGQYRLRGPGEPAMEGFRIVRGSLGEDCVADLSEHADSGSVWYRQSDKKGLGLHVGGDISDPNASTRPAIACYLARVLDVLDVDI